MSNKDFRQSKFADSAFLELHQCQGINLAQRNRLGDFVIVAALFLIRRFELFQADIQALTGKQAVVCGIPVSELNEIGRRQPTLESENLFGALGQVICQLVSLMVERPDLAFHPRIKFFDSCICCAGTLRLPARCRSASVD